MEWNRLLERKAQDIKHFDLLLHSLFRMYQRRQFILYICCADAPQPIHYQNRNLSFELNMCRDLALIEIAKK